MVVDLDLRLLKSPDWPVHSSRRVSLIGFCLIRKNLRVLYEANE